MLRATQGTLDTVGKDIKYDLSSLGTSYQEDELESNLTAKNESNKFEKLMESAGGKYFNISAHVLSNP